MKICHSQVKSDKKNKQNAVKWLQDTVKPALSKYTRAKFDPESPSADSSSYSIDDRIKNDEDVGALLMSKGKFIHPKDHPYYRDPHELDDTIDYMARQSNMGRKDMEYKILDKIHLRFREYF